MLNSNHVVLPAELTWKLGVPWFPQYLKEAVILIILAIPQADLLS